MSYGPNPWQQTAWDWRAAGNFIGGGAGGGLIVFAALEAALGSPAPIRFACGSVLIALGLLCVWLEIGRPLRALHVYLNPRLSWMSREAILAGLLLPCSVAAVFDVPGAAPVAGVLALSFMYAQARMLNAAKAFRRGGRRVSCRCWSALGWPKAARCSCSPRCCTASAAWRWRSSRRC